MRNFQALRRSPLRRMLLKTYIRFLKLRGEPREIALGFALGVFIAFSPTIGVQMVLAIFLAALLKWSKLAVAVAVWISNPLTAPFIYGVTYCYRCSAARHPHIAWTGFGTQPYHDHQCAQESPGAYGRLDCRRFGCWNSSGNCWLLPVICGGNELSKKS